MPAGDGDRGSGLVRRSLPSPPAKRRGELGRQARVFEGAVPSSPGLDVRSPESGGTSHGTSHAGAARTFRPTLSGHGITHIFEAARALTPRRRAEDHRSMDQKVVTMLDEDLFRRAERESMRQGKPLSRLLGEALRFYLDEKSGLAPQ